MNAATRAEMSEQLGAQRHERNPQLRRFAALRLTVAARRRGAPRLSVNSIESKGRENRAQPPIFVFGFVGNRKVRLPKIGWRSPFFAGAHFCRGLTRAAERGQRLAYGSEAACCLGITPMASHSSSFLPMAMAWGSVGEVATKARISVAALGKLRDWR